MSHADKTILVSGATGRQGGALLKYLLGDGWRIRALTRNPRGRTGQELSNSGVEVVQGDMDDVESLKLVDDTGHLVHRCSCGLAESDVLFQGDRTEVITMFDLEANKAIALRLVEDV